MHGKCVLLWLITNQGIFSITNYAFVSRWHSRRWNLIALPHLTILSPLSILKEHQALRDFMWRQTFFHLSSFLLIRCHFSSWIVLSLLAMSSSGSADEETSSIIQIAKLDRLALASEIKIIPEGGWGWMICGAAFVTQFIVMGIHNSFGILYTTLLEEYKRSKAETGEILC